MLHVLWPVSPVFRITNRGLTGSHGKEPSIHVDPSQIIRYSCGKGKVLNHGMESQEHRPQVLRIAVRGAVSEGAAAGSIGLSLIVRIPASASLWVILGGGGCVGGWYLVVIACRT